MQLVFSLGFQEETNVCEIKDTFIMDDLVSERGVLK